MGTTVVIHSRYLSGRGRVETLLAHFSPTISPYCHLHPDTPELGDLPHHLVFCSSLAPTRTKVFEHWDFLANTNPLCEPILSWARSQNTAVFLQFVLDCSVLPNVISATQEHGNSILTTLFKATSCYCYSMHRERRRLLNLWN